MAPAHSSHEASAASSISDLPKPPVTPTAADQDGHLERTHSASSIRTTKDEVENDDDAAVGPSLSHIDTSDFPSKLPLAMIVVALCLAVFLMALDMTIVATAIPQITDQFHSLNQVGWYGSAFFLTLAAFQSTWGKAYKYFPLKTTFLISIFVFEVGSLICAVANSSTTLIVGRAMAGAGGAGLSSGAYTIIAFSAPPRQRPAFTGILGAVFGIASVVGPLLGGVFTDNLSWRWCFYINLPIGGVAAGIIMLFFTTPKAARPVAAPLREKLLQMDLPGSFIIMASVVCYLLAMQWGGTTKAWSSGEIIGLLVGFGLLSLIFVAVEWWQEDRALLQFRLLKQRTIAACSAFIFIVSGPFFVLLYYLPIYFQATRGVSAAKSGVDNLPLVVGASLFSILSGVLIMITGQYVPVMAVGSAMAAVGTGLVYTLNITSGPGEWIGYQALVGLGLGLVFQVPVIVNQSIVKPADLSTISAMTLFFQTIGGAFFISAAEAGFVNKMLSRLPVTAPGVSAQLVIATGATELRKVFAADQIQGILVAYMDGLRVPFAITIALACCSFLLSFTPRWESIKGKTPMTVAA